LTKALALSLNTVAVRLGLEVGAKTIAETAHRLGIVSDLQVNASIALGTSEVAPLEIVSAYAPFANGGIRVQPHIIMRVKKADGTLVYQRKGASFGRVIEPQYVAMMNAMLQETLVTGTARKAELPGWQAAGKTGTSQDYRDAWFVGYTSQLVAGVWLGNDDGSATKRASGANLPVDIWSRFMREALQGVAPTSLPGGALRDAGPMALAPPPIPPADVPAPIPAPAPVAAPTPITRPTNVAAPTPPAQIQTQRLSQLRPLTFGLVEFSFWSQPAPPLVSKTIHSLTKPKLVPIMISMAT
jgi:penicillin-binding protein 1A